MKQLRAYIRHIRMLNYQLKKVGKRKSIKLLIAFHRNALAWIRLTDAIGDSQSRFHK